MIVCPGGGYSALSDRESEPIVAQYLAAGFATFLLTYSIKEKAANFTPLKEAALAIKYVREHADAYNVDPDYVFISGFSAGGHLAASAGILWDHPAIREVIGDAPQELVRPTAMVLSYPVITTGPFTHLHTSQRLCGKPLAEEKNYTDEEAAPFSLELHVRENTPPAFIWHTVADQAVPVQNSLLLASAYAAAKRPFELHVFPEGRHGLALCNDQTASGSERNLVPHNEIWMPLSIKWLRQITV
jgi:acetyl esterase/lipase